MSNIKAIDTRNGDEVVNIFVSLYLNSFDSRKGFHPIFAQHRNPAHNFTALIIQFLYNLSSMTCYDGRNEASVRLAGEMVKEMQLYEGYDFSANFRKTATVKKSIIEIANYRSDEEMAYLMSCFMSNPPEEKRAYMSFIRKTLHAHNTLQQSFTRFCRDWCRFVVNEKPFGEKSTTIRLAKALAESKYALPMI